MDHSIRLTVQNKLDFFRMNELVASGVPIPQHYKLENLDSVIISDEHGNEAAAQLTPLAWWQDGKSIKWLLVQLRCDLAPRSSNVYELKFADDTKDQLQTHNLAAVNDGKIVVDTGRLRFSLGGSDAIFERIELLSDGEWRLLRPEAGGQPEMNLVTVEGYTLRWGRPRKLEIELNGSERTIVKCCGFFVNDQGHDSDFSYELRIEAVRGQANIKLTHRLMNHHQENRLQELALQLQAEQATFLLGNEEHMVQQHEALQAGQTFGIIQESEDDVLLGLLHASDQRTALQARHQWWMAAAMDSITVMATTKHFYQRYPKSIEGGDIGLKIGLLPGRSVTKDSFIPANQVQHDYTLQEGESRTHEILLSFSDHHAEALEWHHVAQAFHHPMHVLAPWEWYSASRALGDLVPQSTEFAKYEQAVAESLEIFLDRRESMRLYGDRNYGDDQYTGPGSWNNGEYDYAHVGMIHFLRGAGAAWFDLVAAPYAQHMMDIDVCHSGSGIGKVHQHTDWHNSEPPKLGSHAWLRGLLTYFCFTGDFFAKDTAMMIADTWSSMILNHEKLEGTERGMTWPVISMLAMYQTFPEQRFIDAASSLIEQVLDMQDPIEGNFNGSMDRPTTKDRWGTFVIGSPVIESLVMYYQTTDDIRAKEAVVVAAKRLARLNWLEDIGAWEYTHSMLKGTDRIHNAKTDKMVTPAVLYGYLYSGDEELLEKAMHAFAYTEDVPARNGKDLGQTYCFGIRIPALIQMARAMKNTKTDEM